ncbi:hypothetical protein HC024_05430 [Methylococcaceae bacterium WWC4]|nr:hypothetical protein [Methylococcaceae bacterium WWC4]
MSFGRYTQEAYGLINEILKEFSEDDIESIYSSLKSVGIKGWWKWKEENHDLIVQYVCATPTQRKKTKKYVNAFPLLAYAAYQHCFAGYYFLCQSERIQVSIGDTYRGMAATAGTLFYEVLNYDEHENWPWGGHDPFSKNT